ncbi:MULTISPECIES: DegV family protein [Loigolactobacillus]|uniref:Fatty acid-binding protein DegV n=1 Tax=Loigolactobacillus backii TaxID=375175 RepID=A0A192H232_9LACO|nr:MULTISPECIES: DegV family protein [Loigolactobacillus]ANK60509.1 fatty acid-binding protein DegV [Loigolactobacillus backii]ANK62006.1 fatty acid-binding protein DegV [Loigolactobacillus backii]ANK65377.1 fatty acid-binding protein DegV [Loigolactobacillus backii]ANK67927.1 fatty acid-binding protein DegV [Loigolactobacillus backii]ANK68800.1 fatty acid-binding protein DegV [Loigolactobacillus backii]
MTQKTNVAILVDSCSDVPEEFIKAHHLFMVPMTITYHDKIYLDKVTITPEEVYANLDQEVPKTASPTGDLISKAFATIKAEGYTDVIAICISSGLSGTFQQVQLAARVSGLEASVIDTKNIGIASGFSAILATQLSEEGLQRGEIVARVQTVAKRTKVFFYVPTLTYLQKGGRIGRVAGMAGALLNIKPIISCDDNGIYYPVAKVRGEKKALQKLLQLVKQQVGVAQQFNLAVADGANSKIAAQIKQQLETEHPKVGKIYSGNVSPALGVHTGPGLIGVGIQILDD